MQEGMLSKPRGWVSEPGWLQGVAAEQSTPKQDHSSGGFVVMGKVQIA
jgi:hypothetical protein